MKSWDVATRTVRVGTCATAAEEDGIVEEQQTAASSRWRKPWLWLVPIFAALLTLLVGLELFDTTKARDVRATGKGGNDLASPSAGAGLRRLQDAGVGTGSVETAASTKEVAPPPPPRKPPKQPAWFSNKRLETHFTAVKRLGSFLVLGDWGHDSRIHGNTERRLCQETIAKVMLGKFRELGDVKFIINVGDSFYPNGVYGKDDPQWDTKWRNIYHKDLRSVAWYSVYGNHDYIGDPCACGDGPADCAQVGSGNLDFFHMPSTSWYKYHPELGVEVIGLDMNQFMWAEGRHIPVHERCPLDCAWSTCHAKCEANLKIRANESVKLFHWRADVSPAKTLITFSHYPTDFLWHAKGVTERLPKARAKHHTAYFAGHRHSVDNTSVGTLFPNNWVVGGGGGWGCDSDRQGFVVGEIHEDSSISTHSILVPPEKCCAPPHPGGAPPGTGPPGKCLFPLG